MRYIPLTQNKYTIVDNADYPELSKHIWYAHRSQGSFYAVRRSRRKDGKETMVYMARQILGLEHGDKREGDHIHHNTLDNRRISLRVCTHAENMKNRKVKNENITNLGYA